MERGLPEVLLKDLTEIARNGNGHSAPDRAPRPPKGAKAAKSASLQSGRTVSRSIDRWQFSGSETQRRPFGREEATLGALKTLRDLDPQASQAVWNYLRMINPGHDLRTYSFDGQGNEKKEEGPAQAYLDQVARHVGGEYGGGLDQLHNVLALSLITNGAVCAEIALTDDLSDVVDWYPVDPTLIAFKRDEEGILRIGQKFRDGTWRPLNPEQVFYLPLDPDVDDPYGRPPLLPALSAVLSKGQMLNDLRAVAHNQGYPRLNIAIKWKEILEAAPMPYKEAGQEEALKNWTESVLSTIVSDFESLQVDDTFVHYDWVEIHMVGGAAGVGAFDFAALEKILTRQVNSALKTLPILMGINETTSETHGSIQWQIQVQGIRALQRLIKRLIEKLSNVSLQVKGLQAHAKVEYIPIRTVDRLFEAQADFFETRTTQLQEMQGWRSHDEAAEIITGHEAFGPIINPVVPAPNLSTNAGGNTAVAPDAGTVNPKSDTGINKKSAGEPGGTWAAWQMVVESSQAVDTYEPIGTTSRSTDRKRAKLPVDQSNEAVDKYVARTRDIYGAAQEDCVRLLEDEGYSFSRQYTAPSDQWTVENRYLAKDIADQVFGVGYSRSMKRLLRDAFEEGMLQGGIDVDTTDFKIDERVIERVWRINRPFVMKLRDELKAALNDQAFTSLADVRAWFESRAWREDLMGRFLAKQGVAAGYAYALTLHQADLSFVWVTSGTSDSCPTCLGRSGQSFTYPELVSIGFPGGIELECGANCRCSLSPE